MALEDKIKVWRVSPESPAGVQIGEKEAYLVGNRTNFVAVSDSGVVLSGGKGVSIATTSENVRRAGLFIEMNDFVKMVPTTLVTPMPTQVPFPPLGLVSSVMKDMPFFLAMMNSATGIV